MGKCDFCREETGILGREHRECSEAARRIRTLAKTAALETAAVETFESRYETARVADGHKVVSIQPGLDGWKEALEKILDDGILSTDEEQRLLAIARAVGFDQSHAEAAWTKLSKAAVLRDVMSGKVPDYGRVSGHHANLQKSERAIWLFNGVTLFEERTYRSFKGVSHGLSIRIAKGIYYRPSAFRGSPVETTRVVLVDRGQLLVTNKHLYFLGPRKSIRVPYRKIVSFEPYRDAVGIQRDAATARPQVFGVDDAWFAYNLVTNLAQGSD
jgi:hypothetical protein